MFVCRESGRSITKRKVAVAGQPQSMITDAQRDGQTNSMTGFHTASFAHIDDGGIKITRTENFDARIIQTTQMLLNAQVSATFAHRLVV